MCFSVHQKISQKQLNSFIKSSFISAKIIRLVFSLPFPFTPKMVRTTFSEQFANSTSDWTTNDVGCPVAYTRMFPSIFVCLQMEPPTYLQFSDWLFENLLAIWQNKHNVSNLKFKNMNLENSNYVDWRKIKIKEKWCTFSVKWSQK